jgi:hypothetical protein
MLTNTKTKKYKYNKYSCNHIGGNVNSVPIELQDPNTSHVNDDDDNEDEPNIDLDKTKKVTGNITKDITNNTYVEIKRPSISVDQITDQTEKQVNQIVNTSVKTIDIIDGQTVVYAEPQNISYMNPSRPPLYKIPIDTILYHGSQTVDTFDVQTLKLNADTNVVFFSPNKEIAKNYIQDCSPSNPVGYIHKFVVKTPIDKLFIISSSETQNLWKEYIIEEKFCNNSDHHPDRENLHGIGFFVKMADGFNAEFALCNPSDFLTYLGRTRCKGARNLTDDFETF